MTLFHTEQSNIKTKAKTNSTAAFYIFEGERTREIESVMETHLSLMLRITLLL